MLGLTLKPKTTWKASERRMAAAVGGQRVPVTGRARGETPDITGASIAGFPISIEHKYGRRILSARIHEALDQAEAARRGDELAVVTLEEVRVGKLNRQLVLLSVEDWNRIQVAYTQLQEGGQHYEQT